ncbi:MAG: Na+/H+ antiporter subunit D [Syntrophobacteraceae bacterium]
MRHALPLPILIPLLTAVFALLFWRRPSVQRGIGLVGATALLCTSWAIFISVFKGGILSIQIGAWPAPYGITLVADLLSSVLLAVTSFVVCIVSVVSLTEIDKDREAFGYYPLLHILTMGICGSFLTGDIFNLYVWFEVMLIASFVLLGLGNEKAQLEGTIKYVTLNLIASALFLAGVGVLYGTFGTLNMADLAFQLRSSQQSPMVTTLAILFLLAFGIKAAVFPLFFWLPASYHTPPVPVSAIFAGLLTKVGVYALIRFFTLLFVRDDNGAHGLILLLSVMTMIVGILGAIPQRDFRRIASFNLISHIGTILTGLGLFTPLALIGTVFYLVHDMIAKTGLFLFSGILLRVEGHSDIPRLGGWYRTRPALSWFFLFLALAISGIPPLSGFWGKLVLIQAGLLERRYWVVAAILLTGLLTLYSMMKIWTEVFWKEAPKDPADPPPPDREVIEVARQLVISVAALVFLTVCIGVWPVPLYRVAERAAHQLCNPDQYIQAILGERP